MSYLLYSLLLLTGASLSAQVAGHWHLDAKSAPADRRNPPHLTLDVSGDSVAVFDAAANDLPAALVARQAREAVYWSAGKIARTLDGELKRIYLLPWSGTTVYPYLNYERTAGDSLRIYRPLRSGQQELLYVGHRRSVTEAHTDDDRDALLYQGCDFGPDRIFVQGSRCTRYRYRDLREGGLPALDPPLVNKTLTPVYFDLVLGRLDTQRNLRDYPLPRKNIGYGVGIEKDFVIAMGIDSLSRIKEGIEAVRARYPEEQRSRLAVRVHIDRGTKMYWFYHLREALQRALQLKVEYVFFGGKPGLKTSEPLYSTDVETDGPINPDKNDPEVHYQEWRNEYYRSQMGYKTDLPEKNLYRRRTLYALKTDGSVDTIGTTIQVTAGGDFILNGKNVGSRRAQLMTTLNAVMDRRNPRTHIIYLSADANAYYRDFLHARVAVNLAYERKYAEVAQREFGCSYADLLGNGLLANYQNRKKVHVEIPFVLVVQ